MSPARFEPLAGAMIGAAGGAVYWIGAQVWPTSVAVILSMLATALIAEQIGNPVLRGNAAWVFLLLIKYNVLMALSAAKLSFALPPNLSLGLIMICATAASRALAVSAAAAPPAGSGPQLSSLEQVLVLILGFAPAALLGIPGLMALAAGIVARIIWVLYAKHRRSPGSGDQPDTLRQITENCFYLGALATWKFI